MARSPTYKTLFRMHISAGDFSQAKRFLDAASKVARTSDEWWGLMLAAIVCYGRPFSSNERGNSAAVDPKLVINARMLRSLLPDKAHRQLHRRILRLRNKAVAHSESKYHYLRIIRTFLPEGPNVRAGEVGLKSASWHPANEGIDVSAFRNIAHAFETYCRFGRFDLVRQAMRERLR